MQCCIQTLLNEALTDTVSGLATDIEGIFDGIGIVSPGRTSLSTISLEHDLRMSTQPGGCGAGMHQFAEFSAFISSQGYNILYLALAGIGSGTSKQQILKQSVIRFYQIFACLPNAG